MKMYYFVYKVTNTINNKYYIGKHTTDSIDDGYMGSGKSILAAICKYGIHNFHRIILEYYNTEEDAYIGEAKYVTKEVVSDPQSYNMAEGGKGYKKGRKLSYPEIEKLRERMRGSLNPFAGKSHTEETKRLISETKKAQKIGRPHTEEFKVKLRKAARRGKDHHMYGKHQPDWVKDRIRAAVAGKPLSSEHKRKLSLSHTGKKVSEATKQKLREYNNKKVIQYTKDDVMVAVHDSIWDAARSISDGRKSVHSGISNCLCDPDKYKSSSGYKWKYYEDSNK